MRPNLKLVPDTTTVESRTDRFESEMTIHATLDEAKAAVQAAQQERERRRAERRQRALNEG